MEFLRLIGRWPALAVVLVQLALFVTLALLRTVDADEGFYLLASRLVFEGRLPYIDFLYTQMPLVPFVYGAWMEVFGFNWYAARVLSALLATTLGTVIYIYAERVFKSKGLALIGMFLYATSAFTLAWDTVAMTYALSGLLLFAAFAVLSNSEQSRWVAASGVLLGLAVDARLPVLAAAPAFLLGLAGSKDTRQRHLASWLGGLALGLIPSVILAAMNWDAFAFGNLGFHAQRNGAGNLVGDWGQKAAIVAELLNLRSAGGETITFQMPLLLALNAYYVVLVAQRRAPLTIAFTACVALGIALLLPTPTYSQYFVIMIPLLIVNGLWAMHILRQDALHVWSTNLRIHLNAVLGVLLGLYALVVPVVFYRYLSWLSPVVPDLHQVDPRPWSIPAIRAVSNGIQRWSTPGEAVVAWWPGYVFETQAEPVAGMENHGWMEIGMAGRPARGPSIASRADVDAMLAGHQVRLVVPGILTPPDEHAFALASGYMRVESAAGIELLQRPG